MKEMRVRNYKIENIKPYENNPRNNEEAVQYVANSIKEFGFKVPLVIDKDRVIVTGHTRYKAAKLLGMEELPCIMADDLTEEQIKARMRAQIDYDAFDFSGCRILRNDGDIETLRARAKELIAALTAGAV